jgi:hypothetical protein
MSSLGNGNANNESDEFNMDFSGPSAPSTGGAADRLSRYAATSSNGDERTHETLSSNLSSNMADMIDDDEGSQSQQPPTNTAAPTAVSADLSFSQIGQAYKGTTSSSCTISYVNVIMCYVGRRCRSKETISSWFNVCKS